MRKWFFDILCNTLKIFIFKAEQIKTLQETINENNLELESKNNNFNLVSQNKNVYIARYDQII